MNIPRYKDLPEIPELGARHGWDVFGRDDQLGRINLITPDTVKAGAAEIQRGQVFNLSLPLNLPRPGMAKYRKPYEHHIFSNVKNTQDDYLDSFYMQYSSQWDSLRHVGAREFGYYGGRSPEAVGPNGPDLGIEHWVRHGIAGRGVLVDLPRHLEAEGTPFKADTEFVIRPQLLADMLKRANVSLRSGDILILRTGFVANYLASSQEQREAMSKNHREHGCPGLFAGEEMAEFLWDSGVAAIAADNPAVEAVPGDPKDGFLHRRLIPLLGFALGEWMDFEELSADCAKDGRHTCFFTAVPLYVPGAVGSPANAVAIK